MLNFPEKMAFYQAYHRHPHNRMTHFIGVPLIIFALLIAMSWVRFSIFSFSFSVAMIFVGVVLVYHFLLDPIFALAFSVVALVLLCLADFAASHYSFLPSFLLFIFCFGLGVLFQGVGHKIEKRRPAIMDNIWQIFISPIFLTAELFFALGWRKDLQNRVHSLSNKYQEPPK